MRVSVAVATRNGAPFVRDQLASILDQTRLPDEIVVSDDGSDDDTVAIVRSTLARGGGGLGVEVRIFENVAPLGVTANFQKALEACSGDIIVLSDQDDIWKEDRVARAVTVFEGDSSAVLVVCDADLIDGDAAPLGDTLFGALGLSTIERQALAGERTFEALMRRNLVTGATTALRRSLVVDATPFPSAWVHDEWLAVIAAAQGGVRMIPVALVGYRQHGANEIGVRRPGLRDRVARLAANRVERNSRMFARAQALNDRFALTARAYQPAVIDAVSAKLKHEGMRHSLPAARLSRVIPVAREAARGGYRRSGRGAPDIFRDLVQPAREAAAG